MWPGRQNESVKRNGYSGMTLTVAFALAAALSSAVNLMAQHSAPPS